MSEVFEKKIKTFQERMNEMEHQQVELTKELTIATRDSSKNFEEMTSYKAAHSRTADRLRQLIETTVTKMEYEEEVRIEKSFLILI
jgi:hypothetical protein